MMIAREIAKRSYDPNLQVGSIIVSDDNTRMLSVGYNGNYKGGPNERESDDPGMGGLIHAEVNAIIKCDFSFSKKKHMYSTHSPCRHCAKLMVNAEISSLIFDEEYRDLSGLQILKSSGIEVHSIRDVILSSKNL